MNAEQHPADALSRLTRRRFLRWSLYSAAALAGAGGALLALLRVSPFDDQQPPSDLNALSQQEYWLFKRAEIVLLPIPEGELPLPEEVPVLANINAMMAMLPPHVRDELTLGLALFDSAAVIAGWHGKRFVDLDVDQARQYFDDWARGNTLQRTLATVIKKFVYIAYWRDPKTWSALEFDGPVSDRWALVSLGNAMLPQTLSDDSGGQVDDDH